MDNETHLKELLRTHNLKVTRMRLYTLRVLLASRTAMSHAEISEKLGPDDVDKVTLYRTLSTFVEKGLAHRVATEDRNWLYAIYSSDSDSHAAHEHEHDHAHFVCDSCEKIYCFPVDSSSLSISNDKMMGFQIKEKEIRLHGQCPVCR